MSLSTEAFTPQSLWTAWPEICFVSTAAPCLRHEQLQQYLKALGVESPDYGVALEKLWMPSSGESLESPPLRKNRRASFLIVSPSTDGQIDFDKSRLMSVWLDGLNVTEK